MGKGLHHEPIGVYDFHQTSCYDPAGSTWIVSFSTGHRFNSYYANISVPPEPGTTASNWCFTGDFNGDGVSDIACYTMAEDIWTINESLGVQGFVAAYAAHLYVPSSPASQWCVPGDFNGDGKTDIACYANSTSGSSYGYWNIGMSIDLGFSSAQWNYGPITSNPISNQCLVGDFTGNGTSAIACYTSNGKWAMGLQSLTYNDLLVHIYNGIGGTTDITYTPSSNYTNNYLPFVVQNVSHVKTCTNFNTVCLNQDISYSGGFYDWQNKQFDGFKNVSKVNSDSNGNILNKVYYTYMQDPILNGQATYIATTDASDNIYSKINNTWAAFPNGNSAFVYLSNTMQYTCNTGGNTCNNYNEVANSGIDAYDHTTRVDNYVCSNNSCDPNQHKYKITQYQTNTSGTISVPSDVADYSDSGIILDDKKYVYDNGSLSIGNLTMIEGRADHICTLPPADCPPVMPVYIPLGSISYDSSGNMLSVQDGNGNTTTISYDFSNTFPVSVTNALGQTTKMAHDAGTGNILSQTDSNGNTTLYTYDVFGRLTSVIKPYDSSTAPSITYGYNNLGTTGSQNITVGIKNNTSYVTSTKYFDGLGRTYKTVTNGDSGNVVATTTYNELGQVVSQSVPYYDGGSPKYVNTQYDPIGRIIKVTNADNSYKSFSYTGLSTAVTDENGNKTTYAYDGYDNLVEVADAIQNSTYYQYDLLGHLTKVTDPAGKATTISYDLLGHKTSMTSPDMGTWQYSYDNNGNLTSQTDANGQTIQFYYDALNRLVMKDYPPTSSLSAPGQEDVLFIYDTPQDGGTNTIGRLTKSVNPNGKGYTTYSYDDRGRLIQTNYNIDGNVYTILSSYDSMDRQSSIQYPDGEVVNYTYASQSGLLKSVSGAEVYLSNASYTALGQLSSFTYGNSVQTTNSYDPNTFKLTGTSSNGPTGNNLQNMGYLYDPVGNVTGINNNITGIQDGFGYDPLNRLTQWDTKICSLFGNGNGNGLPIGFNCNYTTNEVISYDAAGNRTSLVLPSKTITYAYNTGKNQLQSYTDPVNQNQNAGMIESSYHQMLGDIRQLINTGGHCASDNNNGDNGQPTTLTYFNVENGIYNEIYNFVLTAKIDIPTFANIIASNPTASSLLNQFTARVNSLGYTSCFDATGKKLVEGIATAMEQIDITQYTPIVHDPVFAYDTNGNIIAQTDAGTTIKYNADNKPIQVLDSTGNTIVQYVYDAFGNRLEKLTPSHSTIYISGIAELNDTVLTKHYFAGAMRIASRVAWNVATSLGGFSNWNFNCSCDTGGNQKRYFGLAADIKFKEFIVNMLIVLLPIFFILFWRLSRIYNTHATTNHSRNLGIFMLILAFIFGMIDQPETAHAQSPPPTQLVFYTTDQLGSTTIITDASGNEIENIAYNSFGQTIKQIGNDYAHYSYTGQEYDSEIGIYHLGERLYAPSMGRFVTPDPTVPDAADPQSLNPYTYVINNPLKYTDPSGLDFGSNLSRWWHKNISKPLSKTFEHWKQQILDVGTAFQNSTYQTSTKLWHKTLRNVNSIDWDIDWDKIGFNTWNAITTIAGIVWADLGAGSTGVGGLDVMFTGIAFVGLDVVLPIIGYASGSEVEYLDGAIVVRGGLIGSIIPDNMTLGNAIFLKSDASAALLYHEEQHIKQYRSWGPGFITKYVGDYVAANINYFFAHGEFSGHYGYCNSMFENEAYTAEYQRYPINPYTGNNEFGDSPSCTY